MKTCETCAFYKGEACRRYAPRPAQARPESATLHRIVLWPLVSKDDWCGEYQWKFYDPDKEMTNDDDA